MDTCQFAYLTPRKLDGVIAKLELLSEQHTFIKFLRNVDNAKILSGFVQELANTVGDYQVWASTSAVIFNEHLVRFHYSRECMRRQGISMTIPRLS